MAAAARAWEAMAMAAAARAMAAAARARAAAVPVAVMEMGTPNATTQGAGCSCTLPYCNGDRTDAAHAAHKQSKPAHTCADELTRQDPICTHRHSESRCSGGKCQIARSTWQR